MHRVDVNPARAQALHSLAKFGLTPVADKETLKWLKNEMGEHLDFGQPVYGDFLEAHWLVSAKRRIEITEEKIRWANPLNFRYSISYIMGDDR